MPIRPEQRGLYPANWPQVRRRILRRAGRQCECTGQCGLHHKHRCLEVDRMPARFAKGTIILTIHHIDVDPTNNADDNLLALCQRCHLRMDGKVHSYNRAVTRDRRRGQRRFDDDKNVGRDQ